jgi:hypothetical protein
MDGWMDGWKESTTITIFERNREIKMYSSTKIVHGEREF